MSGNFGARLHHFGDFGHAGQIQGRVNPLGIQVHGHGDQVHVTGALAVAHQGAFHPVCPGHHAEFGSGHRAAPVIVGMQADADVLPIANVVTDPLHLICEDIGRCHFNSRRQVNDNRLPLVRAPDIVDGINHTGRKVQLRTGKTLRRILEGPLRVRIAGGDIPHDGGAVDRDIADTVPVQPEHLLPLHGRGGIVNVNNRPFGALKGLVSPLDQFRASLGQHLDLYIIRNPVFFDQLATEIKVRLAGCRETDFDLFETQLDQQIE